MTESTGWYAATAANTSPVERERDRAVERALERDGRPLDKLVIVAAFRFLKWSVRLFDRTAFLLWADVEARKPSMDSHDAELLKAHAAWIRGLPSGVAPEIFDWGDGKIQKGTIERAREDS